MILAVISEGHTGQRDHIAGNCLRLMGRSHCLKQNVTEGKQFSQRICNCTDSYVRGLAVVVDNHTVGADL